MSKSAAPSVTISASASASSHDPHSLPPNIKGLIQRYLAVSLPTITLTSELIDVLDAVEVIIPPRIQVTMRWWKEDSACSLSVYPRLNSPLPEPVAQRQAKLRQQLQQSASISPNFTEPQLLTSPSARPPASIQAPSQAQAHPETRTQPRSTFLLKRPWTGARLLRVFRKGNTKSKASKSSSLAASAEEPADVKVNSLPTGQIVSESVAKPLPSLPEVAYPITVAYPVRGSLEQLQRYFVEMTSLTLEVQLTPELSALATVPNLTDLFHNIHGTFSGVFPFTTVLQNDNPRLLADPLFKRRVMLGMVVFQAWSQDTSDVGDTSDESDSIATGSIRIGDPSKEPLDYSHDSRHHRQYSQRHPRHTSISPRPAPFQYSFSQQQQQEPSSRPSWHTSHGEAQHSALSYVSPLQHRQMRLYERQQPTYALKSTELGQNHLKQARTALTPTLYPLEERSKLPPEDDGTIGPHVACRANADAFFRNQRLAQPRVPSGCAYEGLPGGQHQLSHHSSLSSPKDRHSHSMRHHTRQASVEARGGPSHLSRLLKVRIPVPETRHSRDTAVQQCRIQRPQRPTMDDALPSDSQQRSQDRNLTNSDRQGSRSRPRAGATAAAIGRLDSVLARGEDLLHGMKTSLELDPEEVRARSARNDRAAPQNNDHPRDDRVWYHENLPYWPAKSRFSLELSIPTAYLTSRGLLKGSAKERKRATVPMAILRQSGSTMADRSQGWGRESSEFSQGSQQDQLQAQIQAQGQIQQPQQQQQQQEQRRQFLIPSRGSESAGTPKLSQTAIQYPQERQRQQRLLQQQVGLAFRADHSTAASDATPTRVLRRSGRPIQFERMSPRPELEGLRKAQEESVLPHYQSFLKVGPPAFGVSTSATSTSRDRHVQDRQQPPYRYAHLGHQQTRAFQDAAQQQGRQQQQKQQQQSTRKTTSYPPSHPSSAREGEGPSYRRPHKRHRRLSSNDRLQIRMNPRAGDIINFTPDLFPARSMSALIKPAYYSSQGSSLSSSISLDLGSIGSTSSMGSEDESYLQFGGGDLEGRQSRLQKRSHQPFHWHREDQPASKRHQPYKEHVTRQKDSNRRRKSRTRPKTKRYTRGNKSDSDSSVHAQRFDFKTHCQLLLTPEVMAACMVENISVEVWKLNKKRQTMMELGSAKLPLHRVLSRILRSKAVASTPLAGGATAPSSRHESARQHQHARTTSRSGRGQGRRLGRGGEHVRTSSDGYKDGWRLEPSVYNIRSRHGTIIGQLDAEIWIHPRSRSDSMVSAAA
ncbi:hypothetical protein BGX28_003523 [Mortierella sp. GBA30]|nr:hypothetical protein BGX28_003523 [Mortierella sp. GBA30]